MYTCNYVWRSIILIFFMHNAYLQALYVRVLLDESEVPHWTFCCSGGFRIINKKSKHHTIIKNSVLLIKKTGNALTINDTYHCAHDILVHPLINGNRITFNQQIYEGFFTCQRSNNSFYCVNTLQLEQYIYSVLKSESWPGWPLEVNMALAISCRSYVVARIAQRRKKEALFDIYNTNKHQTYKGYHVQERLRHPVERTKGVIITHNNKPITAMFDSCCGNIIPALMEGTDFVKFPYLKRTKACNHCKEAKIFQWHAEIPLTQFQEVLKKNGFACSKINKIIVTKKDKAGIVQQLTIYTPTGPCIVSGKKLYGMFKQIKSYAYTVEKRRTTVNLQGYGYGHHLGLCQWGARSMVDKGYNHKDIIKFYYPSSQLQKIT